jgi:hypothetical protein
MPEYYRHTGAAPPLGVLLSAGGGLVTAIALSFVYTYAVVYIPFVYINFFLSIGFGLAIALAVYKGSRVGKIRSTFLVTMFALVCSLIGLYCAWAVDLYARWSQANVPGIEPSFTLDPQAIWWHVTISYEHGWWSFRGGKSLTGIGLAGVWLIEAGVIVGGATYFAHSFVGEDIFCENCNAWALTVTDVMRLERPDATQIKMKLEADDFSPIVEGTKAAEGASRFSRIDLSQCPDCDESNYISVQSVTITTDKKGQQEVDTTLVVPPMHVTPEEMLAILAAADREAPAPEEGSEPSPFSETSSETSSDDELPTEPPEIKL